MEVEHILAASRIVVLANRHAVGREGFLRRPGGSRDSSKNWTGERVRERVNVWHMLARDNQTVSVVPAFLVEAWHDEDGFILVDDKLAREPASVVQAERTGLLRHHRRSTAHATSTAVVCVIALDDPYQFSVGCSARSTITTSMGTRRDS